MAGGGGGGGLSFVTLQIKFFGFLYKICYDQGGGEVKNDHFFVLRNMRTTLYMKSKLNEIILMFIYIYRYKKKYKLKNL